MISYDEDVLKDDQVYRAIVGLEVDGDASIKYLQPRDRLLPAQEAHDSALNYLSEQEEDLRVLRTELSTEEDL